MQHTQATSKHCDDCHPTTYHQSRAHPANANLGRVSCCKIHAPQNSDEISCEGANQTNTGVVMCGTKVLSYASRTPHSLVGSEFVMWIPIGSSRFSRRAPSSASTQSPPAHEMKPMSNKTHCGSLPHDSIDGLNARRAVAPSCIGARCTAPLNPPLKRFGSVIWFNNLRPAENAAGSCSWRNMRERNPTSVQNKFFIGDY